MLQQPLRQRLRVLRMAFQAQVQGLDAQQQQERRERALGASGVAQPVRADVDDVRQVAERLERLGEDDAVVGVARFGELGPLLGILRPLEVAAVHDGAADMHAVAAQELGGGVDRDIDAVLERPEQRRSQHRVIHDHRQAVLVGGVGDGAEIGHIVLGIPDRFQVHQAGVLIHQLVDLLGMIGIEEPHLDAQLLQGLGEERPGASVQAGGGNEVLPGVRDGEDRGDDGRLARGEGQPADAAIERGEPLLQHVVGGVHQARVDVAELAQPEKIRRRIGVFENVARCRVNRDRPRRRGGVGLLAGVQSQRAESWFLLCVCHGEFSPVLPSIVRTRFPGRIDAALSDSRLVRLRRPPGPRQNRY